MTRQISYRQISTFHEDPSVRLPGRDPVWMGIRQDLVSSSEESPRALNFGIWNQDANLPATRRYLKAEWHLPSSLVCSRRWKA